MKFQVVDGKQLNVTTAFTSTYWTLFAEMDGVHPLMKLAPFRYFVIHIICQFLALINFQKVSRKM